MLTPPRLADVHTHDPLGIAPAAPLFRLIDDAIWSRVDRGDCCWNWRGEVIKGQPYRRTTIDGKIRAVGVHRLFWESCNGALPAGHELVRTCDNPRCVRPSHVIALTRRQRVLRSIDLGRARGRSQPTDVRRSRVAAGRPTGVLDLAPDERARVAERFWRFVVRGEGCWEWRGPRRPKGYGQFSLGRRSPPAHRVAFELAHGVPLDGLHALHRCDNPPCCNPDHLFAGTGRDNVADCIAKNRFAFDAMVHFVGSANHEARLSESDVASIRARYASGDASMAQLAREHGVNSRTVADVVHRRTWRHVGAAATESER